MTSSPRKQKSYKRPTLLRVLLLLLTALALLWIWNTRYPPVREYKLFLSETRLDADQPWHLISESWSEADVKRRFSSYPIRCGADYTGTPKITRICAIDLKSLNGVPTMYINFLFAGDRLQRVATAVPWWSHAKGLRALNAAYGPAHATQDEEHSGVRLQGWKLQGGGSVFYNLDRSINPLETNSTQWLGESACAPRACIH